MRLLFVLLIFLLSGCTSTIDCLGGRIDNKFYKDEHNKSVSRILSHYFTEESREMLLDIPCVTGFSISGSYVVGANFWGTLVGIFTGSGFSRKCVMHPSSLDVLGPEAIIHEYIHHLDDFGRDGHLIKFIDLDEFKAAYIRMATDFKWAGLVHYTEIRANRFITDTFGLGYMSEHMAYVGSRMAVYGGPEYMWRVFRKVLRHE